MKIRILRATVPVREYKLQRRFLGVWIDCTNSGALSFLSMAKEDGHFSSMELAQVAKDQIARVTQKPTKLLKPNWQVVT